MATKTVSELGVKFSIHSEEEAVGYSLTASAFKVLQFMKRKEAARSGDEDEE